MSLWPYRYRPSRTLIVGAVALVAVLTTTTVAAAAAGQVGASALPGPSFNGQVFAVAYAGDTIYVGGDFTSATSGGNTVARSRLAALDAVTGALLPWSPGADGQVRTLAVAGGVVYLGGAFHHVGGVARGGLAAVTAGGSVTSFDHSASGLPRSMTVSGGRLYVGGQFSSVDGHSEPHLVAFDLASGAVADGWRAGANGTVNSVYAFAGQIFVGGSFSHVNSSGPARLAALDADDGHTLGFHGTAKYEVFGVFADASGVYAAIDGPGGHAVAYTASGTTRWTLTTDGNAQAVAVLQDTVYVGGHFANVCQTAATGNQGTCLGGRTDVGKLFAVDLSGTLQGWRPNVRGIHGVQQIAIDTGRQTIAVGGDFTTVGGASRRDFAQFG